MIRAPRLFPLIMLASLTVAGPAVGQSRNETLIVVVESGPNSMDIHGVGANRPAYQASWNLYDRLRFPVGVVDFANERASLSGTFLGLAIAHVAVTVPAGWTTPTTAVVTRSAPETVTRISTMRARSSTSSTVRSATHASTGCRRSTLTSTASSSTAST